MAEKEVEGGCTRRNGSGEQRPGPENGRVSDPLQEMVEEAIGDSLGSIVKSVHDNVILMKHLPSAKLLMDLAARLKALGSVPEQEYESFAQALMRASEELQREDAVE